MNSVLSGYVMKTDEIERRKYTTEKQNVWKLWKEISPI